MVNSDFGTTCSICFCISVKSQASEDTCLQFEKFFGNLDFLQIKCFVILTTGLSDRNCIDLMMISVTRLGNIFNFWQLFKAFGNNKFAQISHILRQFL